MDDASLSSCRGRDILADNEEGGVLEEEEEEEEQDAEDDNTIWRP